MIKLMKVVARASKCEILIPNYANWMTGLRIISLLQREGVHHRLRTDTRAPSSFDIT